MQTDTDLNMLCPALAVTAYTMGENKTKRLVVTVAVVYYQPPEISDSS